MKFNKNVCHDCGCEEGQLHELGCDMETCPFCGRQLITCGCCYKLLGVDVSEGTLAYENGLTDEQAAKFELLLNEKGRIPYIIVPFMCALCGELYPDMFIEEDEVWNEYVIPELQDKVLCHSCYDKQKQLFPDGWLRAKSKLSV